MKIFYGAAIQGNRDRAERRAVHQGLVGHIKGLGCTVVSEHTLGASLDETADLMTQSLGELPPKGMERTVFVRDRMIQLVEGDVAACIFEVSVPSLGTGIELAHAYLRPRLGLTRIPILALYERGFWPQGVSSMVKGISPDICGSFFLKEYSTLSEACKRIEEFLTA
jgi:hypothetical protein